MSPLPEAGLGLAYRAAKLALATGEAATAASVVGARIHTVYVARHPDGTLEYVGHYVDMLRRQGEHFRATGRVIEKLAGNLTLAEARGLEQSCTY